MKKNYGCSIWNMEQTRTRFTEKPQRVSFGCTDEITASLEQRDWDYSKHKENSGFQLAVGKKQD